nr:hypothetical protein [Tanacetum cinerariifolium]
MLQICPRVHGQSFVKPPFEEEILAFIHFLRHSAVIRNLTDVNINKLYQPWRSFVVIINKCLTEKSSGYDSLRIDHMFYTIKLVSRHQNTQQFGALLPIELTNVEIRNSNAYKEYYAVATGAVPPKPKASVWKTRSSSDTTITPPTAAAGPRLTTSAKGKQAAKASKAKNLSALSENSTDDEVDDDEGKDGDGDEEDDGDDGEEGDGDDDDDEDNDGEEGDDNDDDQEVLRDDDKDDEKDDEDEGNSEEDLSLNVGKEEGHDEEEEKDELYRDVNINQGKGIQETLEVKDAHVTLTSVNPDVAPLHMTAPTMTPFTIATITTTSQAPILQTTALSTIIQNLPNFGSLFGFDNRLRTLEAKFSEFMKTNQFAGAVSAIPGIVHRYMDQRMNKAVHVAVQLQSDKLREEAQKENNKFLKTIDENMKTIIKEKVKEQIKTSYAVAADLSKMELKKILIEKIEGNKEGKEPESASAPTETSTRSAGRSTQGSKSRQASASESTFSKEPMQTTFQMEEPSHPEFNTAGSESRPPMLNKENYVPWSSRLLRYAKSRPNGKLIHNSILNGPYVRRMIAEPGDGERGFADKFVRDSNKTPYSSQQPPQDCPKCRNPVDGLYCRHCALLQKKLKEQKISKDFLNTSESSNEDSYIKIPLCCDDDDDEESSIPLRDIIISKLPPCIAITPIVSTKDSLMMGDKHLDTILETESDEFIKSSVENFVPSPKITSIKIDPHHLNAESSLIESLLNQDSYIISSSKIDSLLDEFVGELIHLKSIPPGINEADCDPEEEIHVIKKLLYDNSSPHPPEEFIFENSDAPIESFSPFPIPVEDSNSLRDVTDLSLTPDDSMLPGIKDDDYDSERDILILEELLSNDSLLLPKNESFHFDIPSSLCPPAKPPDDDKLEPNLRILTVKVVGDISEHYVPMPRLLPTQPAHATNQKKSPHLLFHRGLKAFQLPSEGPMMIYEGNISILDVSFLHFYPPWPA